MTNVERIKALRYCANENTVCTEIENCGYFGKGLFCQDTMMLDVADALEAAEKRIADQQKQITKLSNLLNNKIEELEAQFLKEGEWKWNPLLNEYEWVGKTIYCPNCGAVMRYTK